MGNEQASLGIHEGGRRAVGDRNALGHARGAGREDDPGVVVDVRRRHRHDRLCRGVRRLTVEEIIRHGGFFGCRGVRARAGDDAAHGSLSEDQPRTLVGVIRVDGHVRCTGGEDAEDRDVQLFRTRRHPHADAIAASNARFMQARRGRAHPRQHLAIAQGARTVVDRGGFGKRARRGTQHVQQRAGRGRSLRATEERPG